jgi:hypothetical protein
MSAADGFEKTNWGWQLHQFQQQIWEWLELQFSQTRLNFPKVFASNWWFPDWLGKTLFWVTIALLVAWISWQAWQHWGSYLQTFPSLWRNLAAKPVTSQASEAKVSEWLKRSQAFARKGNYTQACRYLYMALLQQLNDNGIALHQPSRTDGEYLRLTQDLPQEQAYELLLLVHEQLCFGDREISQPVFEECQQAYREITGNS